MNKVIHWDCLQEYEKMRKCKSCWIDIGKGKSYCSTCLYQRKLKRFRDNFWIYPSTKKKVAKKIDKKCLYCNNIFTSTTLKNVFCSKKCNYMHRYWYKEVEQECIMCWKTFKNIWNKTKTCSKLCSQINWSYLKYVNVRKQWWYIKIKNKKDYYDMKILKLNNK